MALCYWSYRAYPLQLVAMALCYWSHCAHPLRLVAMALCYWSHRAGPSLATSHHGAPMVVLGIGPVPLPVVTRAASMAGALPLTRTITYNEYAFSVEAYNDSYPSKGTRIAGPAIGVTIE
ncbi:hypothetical protein B0I37DRAFT_354815 [Chaetomium sp. MPI-CAGE-AT-0009]|nr:hypothetical protein B0I37DRAFT_354815 [Chaetomium sp. MPI-CAGE-AT-0009]